ncbi:MAG: NAD(P)-binding domain-containing protein [Legionella sp.]
MDVDERICTQSLLKEWKDTAPLFQKNILINCHLTTATLILVELFLFSGAKIKLTCTEGLVCHDSIKNIISELGIYLDPNEVLLEQYKEQFDVILDCGAHLANSMKPNKGFVELTYVEPKKYKLTKCPIISVDRGLIKKIETAYGTGDGFVRAIKQIYSKDDIDFKVKTYMIFGYGKVGQGIASCLVEAGVLPKNIIIIEANKLRKNRAAKEGFYSLFIPNDLDVVKELICRTHCIVTATGRKNSISRILNYKDFKQVEYLANMGTYDEWGDAFPVDSILHQKRPLNFMLDYPTRICYLDPIFAVLACATLDILDQANAQEFMVNKPCLHTEKKVLNTWLHNSRVHPNMKKLCLNELMTHV